MESRAPLLVRTASLSFEVLGALATRSSLDAVEESLAADRALDKEAAEIGDALFALAGPAAAGASRRDERNALLALRRGLHNRRAPRDDAAARLECLPAELRLRIERHGAALGRTAGLQRHAIAAIETEIRLSRAALLELTEAPLVAEGLWLASRSLHDRIGGLRAAAGGAAPRDARFVSGKALAYLARFATKTSPNGVFCATALGAFGGRAALAGDPGIARVEVRLGVGDARKVTACVANDPALEAAIVPRANPTLRRDVDGWTFWKPASAREPVDTEVLSRVRDLPALRAFLEAAGPATLGVADLLATVARGLADDVEPEALRTFYDQLVRAGVLVAEVEIPWSEPRPLAALARRCREAGLAPAWLPGMERIEAALDHAATLATPGRQAALAQVFEAVDSLPHARAFAPDELLRVDAASGAAVTLPDAIRDEVEGVIEDYARVYSVLYPPRSFFAPYARRFLERHPPDTDVPALDLYHGVFEDDDLRRATAFPAPRATEAAARAAFERVRAFFVEGARSARGECAVAPDALRELSGNAAVPRFACGALFQVAAADLAALAAGRWLACLNAIHPGGGLAFSRFARLHGGEAEANPIEAELRRGHAWLARPAARVAEISYMHAGRTANAGLRPPLLPVEIELPGDRASDGCLALSLSDLVVRYDSGLEVFRLRSSRLGTEVLPVVSSGISPEGFVSFLIEIGRQGTQPLAFFSGFDDPEIREWPRFTLGRFVLFRRRWVVGPEELAPLADPRASDAQRFIAGCRLRARRQLPRHAFVHSEREPRPRYVDLESPLSVSQLARDLAPPPRETLPFRLHVTEMLPGPGDLWVRGGSGGHASEFLAQVRRPGGEGV